MKGKDISCFSLLKVDEKTKLLRVNVQAAEIEVTVDALVKFVGSPEKALLRVVSLTLTEDKVGGLNCVKL